MPRPSLKNVRSKEILRAFAACVARFGLEGATQERIAEAAGVKRTILRHYLGNRDAMIEALIDHVAADFDAQTAMLVAALPADNRLSALLDLLFGAAPTTAPESILVFQALVAAAERYPKARRALWDSTSRFAAALEGELRRANPDASATALSDVALGVMGIYFSAESLAPLEPSGDWRAASRRATERLIASLKED